jgi:hypothetical protein
MGKEKRDNGIRYPFRLLLEEALPPHRKEMMDSFAQIL